MESIAKLVPPFVRSIMTDKLIVRLRLLKPGDVVSYDDLTRSCDKEVRSASGRGALQTARHAMLHEQGAVFATLQTIGLKRLSDEEVVETTPSVMRRIRRLGRRQVETLVKGVKDFDRLPNAAKIAHNTSVAQLAAVAQAAGRVEQKRILEMASVSVRDVAKLTLEGFRAK